MATVFFNKRKTMCLFVPIHLCQKSSVDSHSNVIVRQLSRLADSIERDGFLRFPYTVARLSIGERLFVVG